jgi:ATP-dependent helicase/nuclease subunit A
MVSYRDEAPLSPAQRAVLFDAAPRMLVAAGAGSGKTRLLVAYFVHALLDQGVPLDELAAVTFTRKAGAELAERIRQELTRCGRPDLARSIDDAAIGTIHGLCRRLLVRRSLAAGVDPAFGILEADTASLVKKDVSTQAWSRVVEEATEDELQVLASREDGLRRLMLSLYDRLRGLGHNVPQVHIDPGEEEVVAGAALAEVCERALAAAQQLPKIGVALQSDLAKIVSCLDLVRGSSAQPSRERTVAGASALFPSRRTPSAEEWLAPVRDALARYRCVLAERELAPVVAVTNKLLAVFHERYESYKAARGVLDFADLELRAAGLLSAGKGAAGRAGAAATRVGATTMGAAAPAGAATAEGPVLASHVLVDEFQDTNEVQCAIIDGLHSERLLLVGDERQSIYGFRGADVDVFRRREEAADLSQHRLDTNYRSRPELLTFINHLFSREGFFGDGRFNPLLPGREPETGSRPLEGEGDPPAHPRDARTPGDSPASTEILVVERTAAGDGAETEELAAQQAEAYAVAERVRRLVDEEGWHRGDIVILLPALTEVARYQDALLAQGLDVYVVRGKGYYSQDEVADVTALLQLLVNPHDDLSLLTVLRSPLVNVSDDCLYLLGRAARGARARSLWDVLRAGRLFPAGALPSEDGQRLQDFLAHLDELRSRVGRPGLSRLIDDALTACDYDLCLLAAPHSKRRFANVRKLMRMAADYEDLEGPDLRGFVTLMGSLGDMGDDEGNAPSLAEGEDVVRIMTVHQAKGLEFPAVVLAGLCSDPPVYRPPEILTGTDGGMAALLKVSDNDPDRPCWGPAADIIAEQRARRAEEDVRLLYVAMTRARDRLILVGARKADDKPEAKRIGRIVTALGLTAPPAAGSAVPLEDIDAVVLGVAPVPADPEAAPSAAVESRCGPTTAEAPCLLDLPHPSNMPAQVSFSSLAAYERCPRQFYLERTLGLGRPAWRSSTGRTADDDSEPEPQEGREALVDDIERASGLDVGLLVHALLERLDLAGARPTHEDLRSLAHELSGAEGLSLPAGADERALSLVAAFWDSPLAGSPCLASAEREAPFFFVQNGIAIAGVMDLLLRGDNCWLIADYKSNALNGRSPAEAAAGYTTQSLVYCLAALKAGVPAARMELLFLEKPGDPVVFEFAQNDRAELESRLNDVLAGIEVGDFGAKVGAGCEYCGVKDLCAR